MNRNWKIGLLAVVCAAQIAIPANLIRREQATLAQGTAYRFRSAPVDPADPFRGRYVALQFEAACARDLAGPEAGAAFAAIVVDDAGFAKIASLSEKPPAQGDYFKVRHANRGCPGGRTLELPFDRYYLPEDLAPRAEAAYRNAVARSEPGSARTPAFVIVRVLDGHAALEDLYLDGVAVREYLRRHETQDGPSG